MTTMSTPIARRRGLARRPTPDACGRAGGGDRRAGAARVAAARGAVAAGPPQPTPPGWVFTPGIAVAETWDNNVLLATEGSGERQAIS